MDPLARMVERAYAGEPEGAFAYAEDDGHLRLAVLLRPDTPMGQLVALPAVVALGVLDGLEALGVPADEVGIAWPQDVVRVDGHRPLARVTTRAGYADGMFVAAGVELLAPGGEVAVRVLRDAVVARVEAWTPTSRTDEAKAGPWAPFLAEYFDRIALMGMPVEVRYPNGRPYARGVLVGVDVWGRATVRTNHGGDIEFPPERFCIEPWQAPPQA